MASWPSHGKYVCNRVVDRARRIKGSHRSNEISAIPKRRMALDRKGLLVSIDAMRWQKSPAIQIVAQKGDYLPIVKDNQPILHAAIEAGFTFFGYHSIDSVDSDNLGKRAA